MSDKWKGILGSLMVGGSQGYMAGKQTQWAEEAQQMKAKAAQRLKSQEREWKQADALELEGLKQTGNTERENIKAKSATDVATIKAGRGGGSGGVGSLSPKDLDTLNDVITNRKEIAMDKAIAEAGSAPGLSRMLPGDQTTAYNQKVEQLAMQYERDDQLLNNAINQLNSSQSGGNVSGGSGRRTQVPSLNDESISSGSDAIDLVLGGGDQPPGSELVEGSGSGGQKYGGIPNEMAPRNGREVQAPGMLSQLQEVQQHNQAMRAERPDSKDTDVIAPVLAKIANVEISLGDVLKGVADFFSPVASAAGGVADSSIRVAAPAMKKAGVAIAERLKEKYEGSAVMSLNDSEESQLLKFIDEMKEAGAIDESVDSELRQMINSGDLAAVSQILTSLK